MTIKLGFLIGDIFILLSSQAFFMIPIQILIFLFAFPHTEPVVPLNYTGRLVPPLNTYLLK